jgi:hypothetical protein
MIVFRVSINDGERIYHILTWDEKKAVELAQAKAVFDGVEISKVEAEHFPLLTV